MTNARAFYLDLNLEAAAATSAGGGADGGSTLINSDWQCIIDLSDLHQNFHDFTLYGLIPTKIRLKQLRVLRGEFVKMGR